MRAVAEQCHASFSDHDFSAGHTVNNLGAGEFAIVVAAKNKALVEHLVKVFSHTIANDFTNQRSLYRDVSDN